MKVLLVDDDRELVELLTFTLQRAGFAVLPAHDAPAALAALAALEQEPPDVVVLDLKLGARSGFEVLKELRRRSDVPVIVLTGLGAEEDKVRGLELGADDYVTKPFGYRELVARVRAVLRRRGRPLPAPGAGDLAGAALEVGPLALNPTEHTATSGGQPLTLTVTEFRLLRFLMEHAGTVVATPALLRHVWGHDDPSGREALRVTVHRLRRKLGDDPAAPRLLHTVPGVGMMLKWVP